MYLLGKINFFKFLIFGKNSNYFRKVWIWCVVVFSVLGCFFELKKLISCISGVSEQIPRKYLRFKIFLLELVDPNQIIEFHFWFDILNLRPRYVLKVTRRHSEILLLTARNFLNFYFFKKIKLAKISFFGQFYLLLIKNE